MVDLREIILQDSQTLGELISRVDKTGSGIGLIVDSQNRFIALMTDGDIRRAILLGTSLDARLQDVGNTKVTTVTTQTPKAQIAKLMNVCIRHIPILNDKGEIVDLAISPAARMVSIKDDDVSYLTKHDPSRSRIVEKVLVIGGAGYIGSIITRKLLEKGYKVKILDQFLYGEEPLHDIKDHHNLEIVKGDTRHIGDVVRVMHDIDSVIHLAELVGDPACSHDPLLTQETNLFATGNIAHICKHLKISRMIYASSCSVYGATEDENAVFTETSILHPVSLYAHMKIEAEDVLLGMKDARFQPTILRLGTVFGPSPRIRFDLVINLLAAKAIKENAITIFGGDQWRPFVHVEDVADAFILALEAPIKDVGGEVFNVGGDGLNHRIRDIGTIMKTVFPEIEIRTEEKDEDKRNYRVSFAKICDTLGFTPKKSVIDGILGIELLFRTGKVHDYTDAKFSNIKTVHSLSSPAALGAMLGKTNEVTPISAFPNRDLR